jgi:hypothetical protein
MLELEETMERSLNFWLIFVVMRSFGLGLVCGMI